MANLYDSNKYLQVSDFLLIQRTLKKRKKEIAPCEYISNVSSYRSTFHACRLVWPPWTSFPLLTHRVNVQYVVYVDTSPCPAFHITELWAWVSLLVDCNFVIWVLVIAGIDFIRNFKEKKLESEPAGGLKPSTAITLALKQIPSRSNTAYPSPVSVPSFLHPPFIFSLFARWFDDIIVLCNLPQGTFLLHKQRISLYPFFALYREKYCCTNKQHQHDMKHAWTRWELIAALVLGGGAKQDPEFGFPQSVK